MSDCCLMFAEAGIDVDTTVAPAGQLAAGPQQQQVAEPDDDPKAPNDDEDEDGDGDGKSARVVQIKRG